MMVMHVGNIVHHAEQQQTMERTQEHGNREMNRGTGNFVQEDVDINGIIKIIIGYLQIIQVTILIIVQHVEELKIVQHTHGHGLMMQTPAGNIAQHVEQQQTMERIQEHGNREMIHNTGNFVQEDADINGIIKTIIGFLQAMQAITLTIVQHVEKLKIAKHIHGHGQMTQAITGKNVQKVDVQQHKIKQRIQPRDGKRMQISTGRYVLIQIVIVLYRPKQTIVMVHGQV